MFSTFGDISLPDTLPDLDHLDELSPEQLGLLIMKEMNKQELDKKPSDLYLIQGCISAGACLNYKEDQYGRRVLDWAIDRNHVKLFELLIQSGSSINICDDRGNTALHWAARYPRVKIARMLISAGASLDAQDWNGWTPLHEAAMMGYFVLLPLRNTGGPIYPADPFYTPPDGSKADVIRLLIRSGASKDLKDNKGRTPFDIASDEIKRQCPELNPCISP